MVFHEAPHKLAATLRDLAETFGPDRRVSLCRELTKLHEEVRRTTLGQAAEHYAANPPRGSSCWWWRGLRRKQKKPTPWRTGWLWSNS